MGTLFHYKIAKEYRYAIPTQYKTAQTNPRTQCYTLSIVESQWGYARGHGHHHHSSYLYPSNTNGYGHIGTFN